MLTATRETRQALIILLLILLARALTLPFPGLVDPTETRYATVAEEMALSGDWLTPRLPSPEGLIAYLGKPPLHFWMTAASYSLFGVSEWTSRLPSFLAALLALFFIYRFARDNFDIETGLIAAMIAISSGMFFFIAGASVTDVTLTACISASVVSLFNFVSKPDSSRWNCIAAACFGALAFMVKGPIAIVLIGLPFLLWSVLRKDYRWLLSLPWLTMIFCFLMLILPWFIASELANPGFIKYFIWNENIARYLFKDYGDKYGAGHVHPYGMSWLMLIVAFLPWTLLLILTPFNTGIKNSLAWLGANPARSFALCWGISAALFFTLVRQLHFLYILPCIPGLAILSAAICRAAADRLVFKKYGRPAMYVLAVLWIGLAIAGGILKFSPSAIAIEMIAAAIGLVCANKIKDSSKGIGAVGLLCSLLITTYVIAIAALTPHLNSDRSADPLMKHIASSPDQYQDVAVVYVLTRNSYSHYFTARAWETRLSRRLIVEYIQQSDLNSSKVDYVMVKRGKASRLPELVEKYELLLGMGEWNLFRRKNDKSS